jgi:hypothetical protein
MIDCREDSRPCKFGKMHDFKLLTKGGFVIYGCRYCGLKHKTKGPLDTYKLAPKSIDDFSVMNVMHFENTVVHFNHCLN